MVEYIKRYDEFAEFLCGKGFYVVGNDHLGHGKSVQAKSEYGFSVKIRKCMRYRRYSYTSAEDDEEISERSVFYAPDTVWGLRFCVSIFRCTAKGLSGAIIMGAVADHKKATLVFGKRLCRLMAAVRGWHYRSHFVDHLVVGNFNRKFKPARTRADWVTSDREHLDAYVSDPLCSFVFTVNAYYSMFSGMISMQRKRGRLYDSEESADFVCGRFGRSGGKLRKRRS